MYLGRALNLRACQDTEIDHRIRRAWAKFGLYKKELTDKPYSFKDRLQLFNAVVTPTFLYGCCSWAMTDGRGKRIRGAQRKMLRTILGKHRTLELKCDESTSEESSDISSEHGELAESYVEWTKRVTQYAEEAIGMAKVSDWAEECNRRRWRWYGHVSRRSDGRWTKSMLHWTPDHGTRNQGRRRTRWRDVFVTFQGKLREQGSADQLETLAQSREIWTLLEQNFSNFCRELS